MSIAKMDPLGISFFVMVHKTFSESLTASVNRYLEDMEGHAPHKLHDFIMSETERRLISLVIAHTEGNQSRAAKILGISRVTLKKKTLMYDL